MVHLIIDGSLGLGNMVILFQWLPSRPAQWTASPTDLGQGKSWRGTSPHLPTDPHLTSLLADLGLLSGFHRKWFSAPCSVPGPGGCAASLTRAPGKGHELPQLTFCHHWTPHSTSPVCVGSSAWRLPGSRSYNRKFLRERVCLADN